MESIVCPVAFRRKDAARYLGVSLSMLEKLRRDGKLRVIKIGARCLWLKESLDEIVGECSE